MRTLLLSLICLGLLVTDLSAQKQGALRSILDRDLESDSILTHPFGVAVQPGTQAVFVADSGNLRVVKVVDGREKAIITDFPKGSFRIEGRAYVLGPLGLVFLNENTLVVGTGGISNGVDTLNVYTVPSGDEPITADKFDYRLSLPPNDEQPAEGFFYGLAKSATGLYVTGRGDDARGWIAKADLRDGKLENFRRFIATRDSVSQPAPVGITVSPEGYVAVAQMGADDGQADSQLSFYNEKSEFLQNFETGLINITGLAYGPNQRRLYAIDFSAPTDDANKRRGGLYKLIADGKYKCKTEFFKECDLHRPTAMAFDDQDNLYITQLGTASSDQDDEPDTSEPTGSLVVISGLDMQNRQP